MVHRQDCKIQFSGPGYHMDVATTSVNLLDHLFRMFKLTGRVVEK